MDNKNLEVVDLQSSTSILGEYGDKIIETLENVFKQPKPMCVLSIDGKPVSEENIVVEEDYSEDYKDEYESVKIGVLNESKGFLLTKKDGRNIFVTGSGLLNRQKLYEVNSRITDFYETNSHIISSLKWQEAVNKLDHQSIKNNILNGELIVKRLASKGSSKAYNDVKNLIYDLFSNPLKKYSLAYLVASDKPFLPAHRKYLSNVIISLKNNPRDLTFFNEEDLNFET